MARMDSWRAAPMLTERLGCWFAAQLLAGCLDAPAPAPVVIEPRNGAGYAPSSEPSSEAGAPARDASSAGAPDAGIAGEAGAPVRDASSAGAPDAGIADDASRAGTARDDSGANVTAGSGLGPKGRPLSVADCYSAESSSHRATLRYLQVSADRDLAGRGGALDDLKAAAAAHPREEEFALLLGLGSLWRLAEPYDLERLDPLLMLDTIETAERELERAYKLCPTDHRIPAWLGPLKAVVGNLLGDSMLVEEGVAILERAVPHYPDFLTFSRILLYADRPADDPAFLKAVATIDVLTECVVKGVGPACTNTPRVPHNIEGGALYAGDLHAKMQNRAAALATYMGIRTVPEFQNWKYRDLLEERIRTLDARIAAAASESTFDDLEPAWTSSVTCSLCHQGN